MIVGIVFFSSVCDTSGGSWIFKADGNEPQHVMWNTN